MSDFRGLDGRKNAVLYGLNWFMIVQIGSFLIK